jgi:ABC-type phosphonate transport system ATPase subunit
MPPLPAEWTQPDQPAAAATDRAGALRVRDLHKSYPTPAEPLVVLRARVAGPVAQPDAGDPRPSGSGKSTLLNILGTLDTPTAGTVRWATLTRLRSRATSWQGFAAQASASFFKTTTAAAMHGLGERAAGADGGRAGDRGRRGPGP